MLGYLTNQVRDFIALHAAFAVLALVGLLAPLPWPKGWTIFALLVIYNCGLVGYGLYRDYKRWLDIWLFVFPLSLMQIFPDWFLSSYPGSLVFPDLGFPFVGTVPIYMGFMWSIPMMVLVYYGWRMRKTASTLRLMLMLALLSGLIFGAAEATLWMVPIWYASESVNLQFGGVALYVILAELLLGPVAYYAYRETRKRSFWLKVWAAFIVMLIYTGALVFWFLLIEHVGFGAGVGY